MVLRDGYLVYRSMTPSEFIQESLTWTNEKLVSVICDNQVGALNELGPSIITLNFLNDREVRAYDANNSLMLFEQIARDYVPYFSDRIFEFSWRNLAVRNGETPYPPTNVNDSINYEFIRKEASEVGYFGLFFIKINPNIQSIDKVASDICMDYTYVSSNNEKHYWLIKNTYKYYIYNQSENKIYDFQTF